MTIDTARMEQLITELREAEAAAEAAAEQVSEAKATVREKAELLRRRQQAVREIIDELTGKSARPLLEAIAANEEESADERQRGPTQVAGRGPRTRPATTVRDLSAAVVEEPPNGDADAVAICGLHPPIEWTSADLELELERAITTPLGVKTDAWATFRELGFITDAQITGVLCAIWPRAYGFQAGEPMGKGRFAKVSPGYTINGFPTPKFWVGARRAETMHRPTLEGRPLVDRIRGLLGLPRVPQVVISEAEAADRKPFKKRRPAVAAGANA